MYTPARASPILGDRRRVRLILESSPGVNSRPSKSHSDGLDLVSGWVFVGLGFVVHGCSPVRYVRKTGRSGIAWMIKSCSAVWRYKSSSRLPARSAPMQRLLVGSCSVSMS